jgi:DNA-binding GntR family transcriptional regulator
MDNKNFQTTRDDSFPRTLAERIYISIKDSILNGEIKNNQRIIEKEIASRFKVSHTPVREAIKRLASEGLIIINSHRESYVRKISYMELINIYYTMIAIDEMALKLAFNRAPDITIKEIEKYVNALKKVAKKEKVGEYLDLNERMHIRICELSSNDYLYHIRKTIYSQLGIYKPLRFFLFSRSDAIDKTMEEFKSLLRALKSRDKRKIKHINRGRWIQFLPSEAEWHEYESENF